jgi:peptide/nickel transport system permease protein
MSEEIFLLGDHERSGAGDEGVASEGLAVATPRQLMVRRFKKHRLAVTSAILLGLMYLVAGFAEFISPYDPNRNVSSQALEHNTAAKYVPPQIPGFRDGDGNLTLRPQVYGLVQQRDPDTFRITYLRDRSQAVPVSFLVRGDEYELWGLFRTDLHLFGVDEDEHPDTFFFPLGSDRLGRDMFSRIVYGSRISLSIGMVSVIVSLSIGVLVGGISGYFGGWIDSIVQRVVEFLLSIPHIPLWMGLAAALPPGMSQTVRYFMITVILALVGWPRLARVVRGLFLTIRDEDYVLAARFSGASHAGVILRHITPAFTSHIIASLTLAVPYTILAETSLSFLGLGLRTPTISWGVLIQEAQNIRTVALTPWLLLPGLAVVIAVLAFNFLGDGLRDAADPYSNG